MFITCFYAILEPNSGSLSYANAGHDLPYLWHGDTWEELRARGMPLGLMPGTSHEEKEVAAGSQRGSTVLQDRLVEAHHPKGEMFGFPRLRALVVEHAAEEGSVGDFILEELCSFVGESWEEELDDSTLLTLRRSTAKLRRAHLPRGTYPVSHSKRTSRPPPLNSDEQRHFSLSDLVL